MVKYLKEKDKPYERPEWEFTADPRLAYECKISRYIGKLLKENPKMTKKEIRKKVLYEFEEKCPEWILDIHYGYKQIQYKAPKKPRRVPGKRHHRSYISKDNYTSTNFSVTFVKLNADEKLRSQLLSLKNEDNKIIQKFAEKNELDPKACIDFIYIVKNNDLISLKRKKYLDGREREIINKFYGKYYLDVLFIVNHFDLDTKLTWNYTKKNFNADKISKGRKKIKSKIKIFLETIKNKNDASLAMILQTKFNIPYIVAAYYLNLIKSEKNGGL